jgi:hypothetical protein
MQQAIIRQHINTVKLLRLLLAMFADACSFESSRVESARMHAFHENLATFI